jgi:hypothetical protein
MVMKWALRLPIRIAGTPNVIAARKHTTHGSAQASSSTTAGRWSRQLERHTV